MPRLISPDAERAAEQEANRHLRSGALRIVDGTVIGVSSTAPAYSLTATVPLLTAAVGLWSPSAMIVAFLPMVGVAIGFYWLNRRIPNCGTSYAWIHPRYLTPWFSTVVMGAVSVAVYVISLYASGGVGNAISNAILAIGLQIAFYYGLTGIAATRYYRRLLVSSAANFVLAGLCPLLGGLGFFYIFYEAAKGLTIAQFWTGVGAMLIGIPLLVWSWLHNPGFYRQPTEAAEPGDGPAAHIAPAPSA